MTFSLPRIEVNVDTGLAKIEVKRINGNDGKVGCSWNTMEISAKANQHFVDTKGMVLFDDEEDLQVIEVPLISSSKFEEFAEFKIVLIEPQGNCSLGNNQECYVRLLPPIQTPDTQGVHTVMTPGSPPGKPGQVTFDKVSNSSVRLAWTEPNIGEISAYWVEYYQLNNETETTAVVSLKPNQKSLLVENLIENTFYVFAVRAENQWGFSENRWARGIMREREEKTDEPTTIVQAADDDAPETSFAKEQAAEEPTTIDQAAGDQLTIKQIQSLLDEN